MYVHRSNRLEPLVSRLAEVCVTPALPPLTPETIIVQNKGMGRWLGMELSRRLFVFANAKFPTPRNFLEAAFTAVLDDPIAGAETTSSYSPDRLVWSIAALLPDLAGDPAFAELRGYLADDRAGTRRIELATRLAQVFDSYPVYRPELVLGWEQGLSDEWQAVLWRALVARNQAEPAHLARRAESAIRACAKRTATPSALPARVSIFGIDSLPPLFVEVFAALSKHVEVHLFLISPSRAYWGEISSPRDLARARATDTDDNDALALTLGNPLLASFGRVGRDFQHVLEGRVQYQEDGRDLHVEPSPDSMLGTLQADILALQHRRPIRVNRPDEQDIVPPLPIDPRDRSIAVHACHGPMREVEVLRDQLLAMLHEEPDLEPRDIVVMTPDLETYAPLIEAVLGASAADAGHVPFRIADRGARAESPAAAAFLALLDTATGRLTASSVTELLAREPIRARFDVDEAEVTTIQRWITEVNVRWGIDGEHRKSHGQPAFHETTWRFGLDRLFLGYAMPGDDRVLFRDTLPFDDIEGSGAELLGRFANFCEALFALQRGLAAPRSIAGWHERLTGALDDLVRAPDDDTEGLQQIREILRTLSTDASAGAFDEAVPLDVVRSRLRAKLEEPSGGSAFLAGGVTVCALLPMRSIPFRAICLLGMNDGTFPRAARPPSFDLIARHPRRGDRSLRNQDRYLFLEAILSARSRLLITYVGQSAHENAEIPPSVVVSELLDVIDESFTLETIAGPRRAREHVSVRHPLQPFSPAYFRSDGDHRLFSYSPRLYEGARASLGPRAEAPPFFPRRLPPPEERADRVTLEELCAFFASPMKAILRNRLGVRLGDEKEAIVDREPMELDKLEEYKIGTDLLRRALAGQDLPEAYTFLRAKGALPLGAMGRVEFDGILPRVDALAAAIRGHATDEKLIALELDVVCGTTRLTGFLRNLYLEARVEYRFASVKPKDELDLWIRHLGLICATKEGYPRTSVHIGLGKDKATIVRFNDLGVDEARARLTALLRLYHLGQCVPLCFFAATSYAYATARHEGNDETAAESRARALFFEGGYKDARPESADPYVARVLSGRDPTEPGFRVLDPIAGAEEPAFADLAAEIFGPLLDHREEA
ncbi:MAG: exodeoxyribonuclease V subunit gamma [Byssovorax sp.]